jgi:hypothetical protein
MFLNKKKKTILKKIIPERGNVDDWIKKG